MTQAPRGQLLHDGRYRLVQRIAAGGMGVVWQARDERLQRDVAIKLVRSEYADDPTFRQRMQAEARAIAAIRSPHVVRVHDVCEERDDDGEWRSYLVMEPVEGRPLSARLAGGPLAPEVVADVVAQAAEGLAAAHARGIVHRDVKPANVMVDDTNHVTVLDFGIARAADAVAFTATNVVMGTARYLAPEQLAGRSATAASDVYALGVVAYEAVTGRVPFDADADVAVALAHLRDPVPPLPLQVPRALAALIEAMLEKDPELRPSAGQVAATARVRDPMIRDVTMPLPLMDDATAAFPDPATETAEDDFPFWLRPVPLLIAAGVALLAILVPLAVHAVEGGAGAATATSSGSAPNASASSTPKTGGRPGTKTSTPSHRKTQLAAQTSRGVATQTQQSSQGGSATQPAPPGHQGPGGPSKPHAGKAHPPKPKKPHPHKPKHP